MRRLFSGIALVLLCLVGSASASGVGLRYTGRVLYRANKAPVPGVLVEIVEAEDNGQPTDDVLGSARADAEGRFVVALAEATNKPVTLVISAVRATAETGGDKRADGIEVKTHRTLLGFLPHPSPAKSNTVLVERRKLGQRDE